MSIILLGRVIACARATFTQIGERSAAGLGLATIKSDSGIPGSHTNCDSGVLRLLTGRSGEGPVPCDTVAPGFIAHAKQFLWFGLARPEEEYLSRGELGTLQPNGPRI